VTHNEQFDNAPNRCPDSKRTPADTTPYAKRDTKIVTKVPLQQTDLG